MRCVALRHSSKSVSGDHMPCYDATHSHLADTSAETSTQLIDTWRISCN